MPCMAKSQFFEVIFYPIFLKAAVSSKFLCKKTVAVKSEYLVNIKLLCNI